MLPNAKNAAPIPAEKSTTGILIECAALQAQCRDNYYTLYSTNVTLCASSTTEDYVLVNAIWSLKKTSYRWENGLSKIGPAAPKTLDEVIDWAMGFRVRHLWTSALVLGVCNWVNCDEMSGRPALSAGHAQIAIACSLPLLGRINPSTSLAIGRGSDYPSSRRDQLALRAIGAERAMTAGAGCKACGT